MLLLPLASLALLQIELQTFMNTLLNGVAKQTVLIVHSNDTSHLVDIILSASSKLHHNYRVVNFEVDSVNSFRVYHETEINPNHYLMINLMVLKYAKQRRAWLNVYMGVSAKTKMIWMFLDHSNLPQIENRLGRMHNQTNWLNSVILYRDQLLGTLHVLRRLVFKKTFEYLDTIDNRFAVPGTLFNALFIGSYSTMDGRPFYVFSEPDVPKVALVRNANNQLGEQKFVIGSDVSLAILIGRFMNASICFTTSFDHSPGAVLIQKHNREQFKQFIGPLVDVKDENMDEVLPWHYNKIDDW